MHLAAETHVDRSIMAHKSLFKPMLLEPLICLKQHDTIGSQVIIREISFHHISMMKYLDLCRKIKELNSQKIPRMTKKPIFGVKASSDHLVRAWHETYGLPVILSNCSNNYGPYHFQKIYSLVIINAITDKPIPIYGDGSNVRDWLFVDDNADALLLVLERGKLGRNYTVAVITSIPI